MKEHHQIEWKESWRDEYLRRIRGFANAEGGVLDIGRNDKGAVVVHLLEPSHNARFIALMDQFLPKWQNCRKELNRLPVRHENWVY